MEREILDQSTSIRKLGQAESQVGIDMVIINFATLSIRRNYKISNHLAEEPAKIGRKAQKKLVKQHAKIANCAEKLTPYYIKS
ncbi:MAG: hypothetical protein LBF22_01170 [Deltaproteobacteria bacterium]|jgi:hypothetical protein|nr:hypothetical protein [Deltaproteobacteria bacterium]